MTKFVILNSDDFGLSDGVNRGIMEAHRNGLLSSTCAMVNMPSAGDGIRQAQEQVPDLGIGLHLTLSFGKPVSSPIDVPSLVDSDGQFSQTSDEVIQKMSFFDSDDLMKEVHSQFDHFVTLAGRLPTHLDSHHGATYMHPAAFDSMCYLCNEYDIPMRRPRWLDNPKVYDNLPINADGTVYQQLHSIYEKYDSPRCPDKTVDTFQWERGDRLSLFQSVLSQVTDGYTEVICHVGYTDGLTEAYAEPRKDELRAVVHPQLLQTAEDNHIVFITFSDLP